VNGVGPGAVLLVGNGSNLQGENTGCVFIGRAMQFAVFGTAGNEFDTYNLVGLQYIDGGTAASGVPTSIQTSRPVAIAPSSNLVDATHTGVPDAREIKNLDYGLRARTMQFYDSTTAASYTTRGFAIVSSLGQTGTSGSGAQTASLYGIIENATPITPIPSDINSRGMAGYLDNGRNYRPASSVTICFEGGAKQKGTLTIGNNGRQLSTSLAIASGTCP